MRTLVFILLLLLTAVLGDRMGCKQVTVGHGYQVSQKIGTLTTYEEFTFSVRDGMLFYQYAKAALGQGVKVMYAFSKYGMVVEHNASLQYSGDTNTFIAQISLATGWSIVEAESTCPTEGATAVVVILHAESGTKIKCTANEGTMTKIKCDLSIGNWNFNNVANKLAIRNAFVWGTASGSSFRNATACIGGNANSVCIDTSEFPGVLLALGWKATVTVNQDTGVEVKLNIWLNDTFEVSDIGKFNWFTFNKAGAGSSSQPILWDPEFELAGSSTSSSSSSSSSQTTHANTASSFPAFSTILMVALLLIMLIKH